jgi:transposase
MGLLMDKESLPIMYRLFPGNTHDSQTLMPMLAQVKRRFKTKRIITVADKALNSGDNIVFNAALGDGYIFSKSVRGAGKEFKEWVTSPSKYKEHGSGYRYKSKIVPDAEVTMHVEKPGGRVGKKTVCLEQKWVAFYSEKYAVRAKHKRNEVITKAMDMIKKPYKYKGVLDYGAAGYIKSIKVDKNTGNILESKDLMYLDEERIAEEEQLDGYYALITSELDDTDEHIINTYHGLWRIEETFKITKSVLGTRPIYVSTPEHVNAHMLICFIALLIGRIIERRLERKYNFEQIVETLRKIECSYLDTNIWMFDYASDFTDELNRVFGTAFGKKHMTLAQIKNYLAGSKNIFA